MEFANGLGGVVDVLLHRLVGLRLLTPEASFRSLDWINFPAMSLTKIAGSLSRSRMASSSPYVASRPPCCSLESQMLEIIRRRFNRTAALWWWSFCPSFEKRSGRASVDATGGLKRRSFCKGSRRFSKAFAFERVKHRTMASVNDVLSWLSSKRCSSTFAVSS